MGIELDFDELRELAERDPQAFERRRQQAIEAAIRRAPVQRRQRLQGLQWRIEQIRRRSPTPLAACISLSGMMWEAVTGEEGLNALLTRPAGSPRKRRPKAQVLRLRQIQH